MPLLDDDHIDPVTYVRDKFKMAPDAVIDPALAKSKLESDKYIEMLTRQKDELAASYLQLKADYDARAKLEEYVDKIASREPTATTPNANIQPPLPDFDKLLDSKLSALEQKRKAEANLKAVKETLREKLGNNYASTIRSKMDELDLTEDEMDAMAARSPKAFIRTLGLDEAPKKDPFQAPPSSMYKSDNFKPKTEERTWEYYQKLKQENPRAWLDPKIQTQMYHDAQRLGAAFGDSDFNKYNERLPN